MRKIILLSSLVFTGFILISSKSIFSKEISIDEKIAQMIVLGFQGTQADNDSFIINAVERNIGGVILFDIHAPINDTTAYQAHLNGNTFKRNIESPSQVKELCQTLQNASKTPLFIMVDAEGGNVYRLKKQYGFDPMPSHQEIGNQNDQQYTYSTASTIAQSLKDVGVNFNLAPVVDLKMENNFIGNKGRCFSSDPESTVLHATNYIKAHTDNRIITSIKHFPGHGSSLADSHKGMADITQTWNADTELTVFSELIENNAITSVMSSHVFHRELDPNFPVSLSHDIVTKLLRDKLGYNGVVVTDDIYMDAIRKFYNPELDEIEETAFRAEDPESFKLLEAISRDSIRKSIVQSIHAGNDIILICNTRIYDESIFDVALEAVKDALNSGVLTEERIDASYNRIMKLKEDFLF